MNRVTNIRAVMILTTLALLGAACAADGRSVSRGHRTSVTAADAAATDSGVDALIAASPRQTMPVRVPGHQYVESFDVPPARLDDVAETAVLGRVVSISDAVLNTVTGTWEPGTDASEIKRTYANLVPYTQVRIEVLNNLGRRPDSPIESSRGDLVTVTVLGGQARITLTPDEARAAGIREEIPEDQGGGRGGFPTEPVVRTPSLPSTPDFEVGDVVMAFLHRDQIELAASGKAHEVIAAVTTGGWGFYVRGVGRSGVTEFTSASSGRRLDSDRLESAAARLHERSGVVEHPLCHLRLAGCP